MLLPILASIIFARRPDALLNPQFWAEDGAEFFRGAYTFGWHSILLPYAGYLHLVPRLVACFANWFSSLYAPLIYSSAAAAITIYTAMLTQSARCPLTGGPLLALAVVLVPDAFEVLMFNCNVQWFSCLALLLVLMAKDPRRPTEIGHDIVATTLFALTGPASVVFAPLYLWRALRRKTKASFLIATIALGAATVQVRQIFPLDTSAKGSIDGVSLVGVMGTRVGASLFLAPRPETEFAATTKVVVTCLMLVTLVALTLRRSETRPVRVVLFFAFVGLLAVSLFRCRFVLRELCHAGYGSRYFIPLQVIVLWLICDAVTDHRRYVAVFASAALVWTLAVNLPRLREPPLADDHWKEQAAPLVRGESATIFINPNWTIAIPARTR